MAGEFEGTYIFEWAVEGAVVRGLGTIPALDQKSAILFYHRPATREIEMVSVGAGGMLWRMTGPDSSETREMPDAVMPDGSKLKLRFTRFNVTASRFESRMERSSRR